LNQYVEFFRTSEKHPESLNCFSISSDGQFLASSCYNLLNIWDLQDGTLICSHTHKWTQLHFNLVISPDWNTFITDYDDRIEIRDLLTGCHISDFSIGNRGSIAVHPDSETLVVGAYGHGTSEQPFIPIDLFNLRSGQRVRRLRGHDLRSVSSVIISPDGSKLVSSSYHSFFCESLGLSDWERVKQFFNAASPMD
jgi:WD40 repeat protein